MSEWISVRDGNPEAEGRYAVCYRYKNNPLRIFIGDYIPGMGWSTSLADSEITHWMPLPEPPK